MSKNDADGLDWLDRKILNDIQQDRSLTNADLAAKVGTSPPSITRRIRQLRANGFIEREVAIVDPKKAGDVLIAISEITLINTFGKSRDGAIRDICRIPEVNQCYHVTGGRDILIISFLKNMKDFEFKITERLSMVGEIRSVKTYFAIRRMKFVPFVSFDL